MRLWVAALPPPAVCDALGEMPRPDVPGVRWTAPDQWHVTLAYLGEVGDEAGAMAAAEAAGRGVAEPPEVTLGPATAALGRTLLVVPARGLEAAAARVRAELRGRRLHFDPKPYRGHVTVARCRGPVPPHLVGIVAGARWRVDGISLMASIPDPGGVRYKTLMTATVP